MRNSYFQVYVPHASGKKHNKTRIKSVFITILIFILFFVSVAFIVARKRKEVAFNSREYYFVYALKNSKKLLVEDESSKVKQFGGAGVVIKNNNEYYLVLNVYLIKTEAEEIVEKIKQNYEGAGVLALKSNELTKFKKKVSQNAELAQAIKKVDKLFESLVDLQLKFMSGKLSEGKLSSSLVKQKLEIAELETSFAKSENKNLQLVSYHLDLILMHYQKFFDKFFGNYNKEYLICELAVNLANSNIEMLNNLAS